MSAETTSQEKQTNSVSEVLWHAWQRLQQSFTEIHDPEYSRYTQTESLQGLHTARSNRRHPSDGVQMPRIRL